MDTQTFRDTLAQFATGVTVVISGTGSSHQGMTVNSFTSVSLVPPLILFCADNRAVTLRAVKQSHRFTVSILCEEQEDLSRRFAELGPQGDLFAQIRTAPATKGIPYLFDSLGYLDCAVHNIIPAGDHHIVVGHVERLGRLSHGYPLIYFRHRYYRPVTSPPG